MIYRALFDESAAQSPSSCQLSAHRRQEQNPRQQLKKEKRKAVVLEDMTPKQKAQCRALTRRSHGIRESGFFLRYDEQSFRGYEMVLLSILLLLLISSDRFHANGRTSSGRGVLCAQVEKNSQGGRVPFESSGRLSLLLGVIDAFVAQCSYSGFASIVTLFPTQSCEVSAEVYLRSSRIYFRRRGGVLDFIQTPNIVKIRGC